MDPGRQQLLAALWHEHRSWVAAVLLTHIAPGDELEDLLQDVAATVVRRIDELRDPSALRPWLRSVAINTARLSARRSRTRLKHVRALQPDDAEQPDLQTDQREQTRSAAAHAMALAARLHPDYREPLLLRCVHGMSQRAIAQTLGLPETTIETRLARARAMLRRDFQGALA